MADHVDAVTQEEVEELTEQFYVTLRAEVARLSPQDEARSPKSFQQIQDLLNGRRAVWSDAYQIEQLMVDLFDERTLEIELQSRLLEGDSNLRPALIAQYTKLATTLKTAPDRRALLARLINDLQWRYTVNEVKRSYSKEITKTTGLIFMLSICLFAAMIATMALFPALMPRDDPRDSTLLLVSALAGGWGAAFSMLSSVKGRLESADLNDLKLMRSGWILWSRPLIGVGAAAILYFFTASGLLAGAAFPTFVTKMEVAAAQAQPATPGAPATPSTPGIPPAPPPRTQLALLIVWCFLAGFSERLVPSLLAKTEDRAQAGAGASDRFKPSPLPSSDGDASKSAAQPAAMPASQPSARAADAPSGAAPTS
jgi:hypothetical protein